MSHGERFIKAWFECSLEYVYTYTNWGNNLWGKLASVLRCVTCHFSRVLASGASPDSRQICTPKTPDWPSIS